MLNDDFRELTKKDYLQLCYLLLLAIPTIWIEVKIDGLVVDEPSWEIIQIIFFLSAFGLMHIVSCDALSYLYNLNRLILPSFLKNIYPVWTAKHLKIVGAVFLTGSLILIFLNWSKIVRLTG